PDPGPFNQPQGPGEIPQFEIGTGVFESLHELSHADAWAAPRHPLEQPVRIDVEAAKLDLLDPLPPDEVGQEFDLFRAIGNPGEGQEVYCHLAARSAHDLRRFPNLLEAIAKRPVIGSEA